MTETKKRILFVEDDKAMSGVLSRKLESSGFEVAAVEDGEAAVQALASQQFDLVLLDLMLPKLDGFGVLAQMREHKQTTPVIVLSNLGQAADELKVKELGAIDYMVKVHITPAAVVERINRFFSEAAPSAGK